MKKHFKRSRGTIVTVILFSLWCVLLFLLNIILPNAILSVALRWGMLLISCSIIISTFVSLIIPDFDYVIDASSKPEYLVFDLSETNRRILNKHFTVFDRNRRTIVLCDESGQKIPIRYNKEVLEFLEQFSPVTGSKAPRQ